MTMNEILRASGYGRQLATHPTLFKYCLSGMLTAVISLFTFVAVLCEM